MVTTQLLIYLKRTGCCRERLGAEDISNVVEETVNSNLDVYHVAQSLIRMDLYTVVYQVIKWLIQKAITKDTLNAHTLTFLDTQMDTNKILKKLLPSPLPIK